MSADRGSGVVAYGQPGLGPLSGVEVHGRSWPSHFGARPAGIDGVAQNLRPASHQCESEGNDVQFALGVGSCRIPRPLCPVKVAQRPLSTAVQTAAEVYQSTGTLDQRR
jgi:hypothetical protein